MPPSLRTVSFVHVTLFPNLNILFAVFRNPACFCEVVHKRWAEPFNNRGGSNRV